MEYFEFDPKKSRLNKERHGIDLEWAEQLWNETHVVIPAKNVSGESRYLMLAKLETRCYAAIFTLRDETIRLISCHRADGRLEKIYEERVENKKGE